MSDPVRTCERIHLDGGRYPQDLARAWLLHRAENRRLVMAAETGRAVLSWPVFAVKDGALECECLYYVRDEPAPPGESAEGDRLRWLALKHEGER